MMDCKGAAAFVDGWEDGKESAALFRDFSAHLETCGSCAAAYAGLLPLIKRDCGLPGLPGLPDQAGLSDRVMVSIRHESAKRFFRMPGLAAAAAIAVFVLGVSLGTRIGGGDAGTATVTFVLDAPAARTVSLAGDFTAWSTEGYSLSRIGQNGTWQLRLPMKKGKVYVYNFVIDGEVWIPDPAIPARVDDGFGGSGSLLRL